MNIRIPGERPLHSDLGRMQVFTLLKRSDFLTSLLVILSLILLVTSFAPFALLAALTASLLIVALRRDLGRKLRRMLLVFSTVLLIMLTIPSAIYARTITVTLTHTEYRTTTTTLWQDTTTTPTTTITRRIGSTTTIFLPTTTYITKAAGKLEIVEVIVDPEPAVVKDGWAKYTIKILARNSGDRDETVREGIRVTGYDPPSAEGWDLAAESATPSDVTVVLRSGKTETLQFTVKTKWRWISENKGATVGVLGKVFGEWSKAYGGVGKAIGPFVSAIFGGAAVLSDLQKMGVAIRKLNAFVSESSGSTLRFQRTVELEADSWKQFWLGVTLAIHLIVTGVAAYQLVVSLLPQAAAAILLGSLFLWAVSIWTYKNAFDPDPDYAMVQPIRSYSIKQLDEIPESLWKDVAKIGLNIFSQHEALSIAMTRYYAAAIDGKVDYMSKQLSAAIDYSKKARNSFGELGSLFEQLPKDVPRPETSTLSKFKESLRLGGLPDGFVELMKKAGLDSYAHQAISDLEAASDDMYQIPSSDSTKVISDKMGDIAGSMEQTKRELSLGVQGELARSIALIGVLGGTIACLLVVLVTLRLRKPSGAKTLQGAHVALLKSVKSCPVCRHMVRYDSHSGKWYCSHCRRRIG